MAALLSLLDAVVPLWQASSNHSEALDIAKAQHAESIEQAQQHHDRSIRVERELARREQLRDLWAQKNHKAQTLMIVDTLMFSSGFALIVEGTLPTNTRSEVVLAYSASLALAFCALFLSIWFAFNLQQRMSKYVISNPRTVYTCGRPHVSFYRYYQCHCRQVSAISFFCFYLGVIALVAAAAILAASRFWLTYKNKTAALIFMCMCVMTLAVLLLLWRIFPAQTRLSDFAHDHHVDLDRVSPNVHRNDHDTATYGDGDGDQDDDGDADQDDDDDDSADVTSERNRQAQIELPYSPRSELNEADDVESQLDRRHALHGYPARAPRRRWWQRRRKPRRPLRVLTGSNPLPTQDSVHSDSPSDEACQQQYQRRRQHRQHGEHDTQSGLSMDDLLREVNRGDLTAAVDQDDRGQPRVWLGFDRNSLRAAGLIRESASSSSSNNNSNVMNNNVANTLSNGYSSHAQDYNGRALHLDGRDATDDAADGLAASLQRRHTTRA